MAIVTELGNPNYWEVRAIEAISELAGIRESRMPLTALRAVYRRHVIIAIRLLTLAGVTLSGPEDT